MALVNSFVTEQTTKPGTMKERARPLSAWLTPVLSDGDVVLFGLSYFLGSHNGRRETPVLALRGN